MFEPIPQSMEKAVARLNRKCGGTHDRRGGRNDFRSGGRGVRGAIPCCRSEAGTLCARSSVWSFLTGVAAIKPCCTSCGRCICLRRWLYRTSLGARTFTLMDDGCTVCIRYTTIAIRLIDGIARSTDTLDLFGSTHGCILHRADSPGLSSKR
jgi:hypothetical protein